MKGWTLLVLLVCFCHQSESVKPPDKKVLCGLSVDKDVEKECLKCFNGTTLSETPEEYRKCVATYLPPMVAICAVPHHERGLSRTMVQHKPQVHHNHTNANLMPNCLKRRMRDLSRYLKKENSFAKQAGAIVKTIVLQDVIPNGGPNMLGIISQRYIFDMHTVQPLVKKGEKFCQEYLNSLNALRSQDFVIDGRNDGMTDDALRDIMKILNSQRKKEYKEEEEKKDEELHERAGTTRPGSKRNSFKDNGLPYGGTNSISVEILYGKCVVEALVQNKNKQYGISLINTIANDEFFYPIPFWWVDPLLRFYKDFRENLENN